MYKAANWARFKEVINDDLSIGQLVDADSVDSCVEHLTRVISFAMEESIPKKCFAST